MFAILIESPGLLVYVDWGADADPGAMRSATGCASHAILGDVGCPFRAIVGVYPAISMDDEENGRFPRNTFVSRLLPALGIDAHAYPVHGPVIITNEHGGALTIEQIGLVCAKCRQAMVLPQDMMLNNNSSSSRVYSDDGQLRKA